MATFFGKSKIASAVLLIILAPIAWANSEADADIERISVIGSQRNLELSAGSVSLVDKEELETFEYDDIASILAVVPGVNIRREDGFGLRPNIGFRGVTPERSRKINIMEDGLLIGPAPYSAPAAYFFPITTKMVGVEVTKGPAAIKYGPYTVAGALNLITRGVSDVNEGEIDLAVGSFGYQKAHGYYNHRLSDKLGVLVEGVALRSDGFQELDNGGDVGFEKNDYNIKLDYDLTTGNIAQKLIFKANYADEVSNFTYTGLSDEDFRETPYRRYAGGQLDQMVWDHSAFSLSHFLSTDSFSISTQAYRTDLDRAWNKLNNFVSSFGETVPVLLAIVSDPTEPRNAELLAVLRGERDSTARELLELGNNDRTLFSQGIQVDGDYNFETSEAAHLVEFGVRFHNDEIQRNHTVENFNMRSGILVPTGEGSRPTTTNTETTDAWSFYAQNTTEWRNFVFTAGVRYEHIAGFFQNRAVGQEDDRQEKTNDIVLPRLSALFQINQQSVVFAGVHRGFVPTSPRQDESIEFEKSTNYELGYRYTGSVSSFESVAFFNDYANLIESCSFSAGCDSNDNDLAFSGGEVNVYGLELSGGHQFALSDSLRLPINLVYTFTESEFKDTFFSPFPLWGFVEAGNPLPYLARHTATLSFGLFGERWGIDGKIAYTDGMPESGQAAPTGDPLDNPVAGVFSDSFTVVDIASFYQVTDAVRAYLKVDNLFNDVSIVSRRPYGARPNRPRQVQVGVKYSF